jgi:hypothetical protein
MGLVDSKKGQDHQFVQDQFKIEKERIKREEAENFQRKKHAIEMAKETMQKEVIKKRQQEAVKETEDAVIRDQLIKAEKEEIKRLETQHTTKMRNQTSMKQYLDVQTTMKHKRQNELKAHDRVIAQIGIEKEAEYDERRKEYFERLQKFQDMNDQKMNNFVKYMQADPTVVAETRDK